MVNNRPTMKLIIAAALYTGFVVLFFADITGISAHQWLGVSCGALAIYHLLDHWGWFNAVSKRLFKNASGKARLYYLVDLILLLGFAGILISGLVISTWLDLSIGFLAAWVDLHITASILTLLVIAFKIIIHGRWIVRTTRSLTQNIDGKGASTTTSSLVPVYASRKIAIERRNFLKLMGMVGAATAVSMFNLAIPHEDAPAEGAIAAAEIPVTPEGFSSSVATPENPASSIPTAQIADQNIPISQNAAPIASTPQESVPIVSTPQVVSQPAVCATRCRKGRSCSFPGDCRDYRDTNSNGLCDNGECV